jgi:uncharacterized membrane protein (Fun14 family)
VIAVQFPGNTRSRGIDGVRVDLISMLRSALVVAMVLAASPAHADDYRAETAVADLVGGGAFAAGIELGTDKGYGLALAVGGATVAALGAPILHGAHGNGGRMAASIILRVALPAAGMFTGYLLSPQDKVRFRHGGGIIGFMAGYAIVTIVDIAMASTSDDPTAARVLSIGTRF